MPRDWGVILFAFAWPPAWAVLWQLTVSRLTGNRPSAGRVCALWCFSGVVLAVIDLAIPLWTASIAGLASAILAVLWWWWRRKRRRLLSLLTGKYRYIRDAMVRTMRERARHRPVLRPVPGSP